MTGPDDASPVRVQNRQASFERTGKERQFEVLKPLLIGESEQLSQAEAATEPGMTTNAVKVAIHRLRKAFRDAVMTEIAQTVRDPDEIDEELRYLIEVLSREIGYADNKSRPIPGSRLFELPASASSLN